MINHKTKQIAAVVLTGALSLTAVTPIYADENSENDLDQEEITEVENSTEDTSKRDQADSSGESNGNVETEANSDNVENKMVSNEDFKKSNDLEEDNGVMPLADFTAVPGLNGDFESLDANGFRIHQQGGDNQLISSVQGKTFNFSADVTFEQGVNKTSLIFGADSNTSPTDIGTFFGLELSLTGNDVQIKLFENPLNGFTLGDNVIPYTTVTTVADTKDPIHWTVAVDDSNNLTVTVNGVNAQYSFDKDFKSAYTGGYFGFLTFQSQVKYENVSLSANPIPATNFNTNLSNLHGLNGTWNETENGLYSYGTGDNFAISDTIVKNFEFSANIKNEGKKGAGSLIFRSDASPTSGSLAMNIDYSANVFKLFSFGDGGSTYETVSLANVPEKEDGSYDLKVQMYENHLRVYVNEIGIINRDIDARPDEGRLGLLTWDGSVVYQNVVYQELNNWVDIDVPHLTGIDLPDGVTITPEFGEDVTIYGMDIQPEVDEATIGLEAPEGAKLYVTKTDENGNIIKEKTEVVDGKFTISSDEFYEDYMNVDVTIEQDGFTNIVNFAVNKWTSTEDLANEEYRAQFHITPQSNFMNDPNGMVYDSTDGYWHVYYQYSTKNNFNNQSWAHVRSKDLVNWEQMPLALQIDDNGLIFSGCGVEDLNNVSGLFTDTEEGDSRLIVYYTYNGTEGQSQAYAYSTDHGVTWKKGGVILDNSHSLSGVDFRDPKVFQVPGDDKHYYMITAGGAAQIFTSTNLIDWEFSQNLTYTDGQQIYSECPMMYEATVEGTNETKWIYGGSAGFYVVGNMKKDESTGIYKWTAESEKLNVESNEDPWSGFGKYATMTFWDDPIADRVIGISWLQDTKDFSGKDYKGVQSLPQEYGLKRVNGQYVITCYPVDEVNELRDTDNMLYESTEAKTVTPEDGNILQGVSGITYDIEAVFDLDDTTASEFGFKLRKGNGQEMVYKYDVESQKMVLDVSKSDSCQSGGIWQQTLVPMEGNKIQLRIIIDQGAVETFGNYGEANISTVAYMSKNNIGMEFFTDGNITIDSMNIYDMKSMYTGESGSVTEQQQLYLDAPEYVETGKEFTINANVYPNKDGAGVEWSYGEGLEVVNEGTTATTLKASQEGTYTVQAKVGELVKEVTVRIADPNFENNADGWEAVSGSWSTTDQGLVANNVSAGDSFYLSDVSVSNGQAFTIEGSLSIREGQAAGITFGVEDKNNPTSNWFCANIDTVDGIAKLFQNTNGVQGNAVSKPLSELQKTKESTYDLRIEYDGEETVTYFVNGIEVGSLTIGQFNGFVGVQTFKSNTIFTNLNVDIEGGTIDQILGVINPITVETGSDIDTLLGELPQTIQVKMDNNTFKTYNVKWDTSSLNLSTAGSYELKGTLEGTGEIIKAQITVKDPEVAVNTSDLENLISEIQNMDLSSYTKESVEALNAKVQEALDLLSSANFTQDDIEAMLGDLQDVYGALVEEEPGNTQNPVNPDSGKGEETVQPDETTDSSQSKQSNEETTATNNETDSTQSKKESQIPTSVAMGAGLFGSLAVFAAFGAGVLSILKRRKK